MNNVVIDDQDEYDPLSFAPIENCEHGACKTAGRVVVKRSDPYGEKKLCSRHARAHLRQGWTFVGTLGGVRFDPWV